MRIRCIARHGFFDVEMMKTFKISLPCVMIAKPIGTAHITGYKI